MRYTPPLYDALEKYAQNTVSRFHMPGHGGKIADSFLSEAAAFDVTELCETDNLSAPQGVIKAAQELAAQRFGAANTLFSCGGATLCIQAAIYAAVRQKPRTRVFCHRRVHKSVINAFTLLDVRPTWFTDFGIDFSECDVLIFTWVDYYGNIAPYEKIEEIASKYNLLTIADNSHGAHLAFIDGGKLHPMRHGVNFCIDSLHKTLPVLTGGACLNISDTAFNDICREGMTLFGSTSPNYLIMASIDRALANASQSDLDKTRRAVTALEREFPKYFRHRSDALHRDPLRILLRCESPERLYEYLYEKGVKCEFYDASGVILIPPYGADNDYFEPLKMALSSFEPGEFKPEHEIEYNIPLCKIPIRKAAFMPREEIPIAEAEGKISAREYSLYPPGIPLIVPGEVFDRQIIRCLSDSFNKVNILNERKEEPL